MKRPIKPRNSNLVDLLHSEDNEAIGGSADRVLHLDTSRISPRDQARTDFGDIESLAASIRLSGQDTPISVRKSLDSDNISTEYVILAGERRWRACALVGMKVLAIDKGASDPNNDIVIEAIENFQRKDLNPFETCTLILRLLELQKKQVEIANLLGRSKQFVTAHLKLAHPREEITKVFEDGITTDVESLSILADIFNLDESAGRELVNNARSDGFSRAQLRSSLKKLKDAQNTDHNPGHEASLATASNQPSTPSKDLPNPKRKSNGSTEDNSSEDDANPSADSDPENSPAKIPHAEQFSANTVSSDNSSGPEAVKVKVVVGHDNAFMAHLVLKRACTGMAWVQTANGDLQEVAVSDLTIQSVD